MQITKKRLKPFEIQRTCVYDGPGIRTTIFFQGCNLRCLWCQNPEGQKFNGSAAADCNYTIEDIMEIVTRDKEYYVSSSGGVTLSGGEPFLQDPDSLLRLLKSLKEENIKVTAETSLHAPWKNISKVAPYIDLFIVDFKVVGNEDLHIKYTKQESTLIHENLKKLLDLGADIKFRMVMVPGYTDNKENIEATAEFLHSINYDSIELMKYHNMYEDKAEQLGLDIALLGISPEQSQASLEKGAKLFQKYGIQAESVDLNMNSSRYDPSFTPRVKRIQKDIRDTNRHLCIESARLKTEYYKEQGFDKPVYIHRAERLSHLLKNKEIKIYPQELIVGNFTPERKGSQLWEEYHGTLGFSFLYNIDRQTPMPYQISLKDKLCCYLKIYPFWMKYSLMAKMFPKISDLVSAISKASDMKYGLNNNLLAIAHFVANYEPILKLGTSGLIKKIKAIQQEKPKEKRDFYEGTITALKGLEKFGQRYANHLSNLSKKESNPKRRKELEKMAKICEHVPKYPARTFHEALQCITFIHIALCMESYENAISFGRLDQMLYPYYKKDKEAGRITYEEAKELVALFVLKMDELVLTTDGDSSFVSAYKAVQTSSTDQALTFGGVDKEGKDATNDVTYMFLDACKLQSYSIDMGARIHEDSPSEYLNRIADLYIGGCPLPQLFSDENYIKALRKHYPTSLEKARDYSIVGCVEPTASNDHFGNTDCANVNLAFPLLQAIKGQDHDLWNPGLGEQFLILVTNFMKFLFKGKNRISRFVRRICNKLIRRHNYKKGLYKYNPPSSMDILLERFQKRLNELTNSILTDHQKIESKLRKYYPTPLASTLFKRCLESGKDVYEGGAEFNSSGIQAVGVTDVADSLYAINEVVYKKKLYTMDEIIKAIENNFQGKYEKVRSALLAVPKFGDDSSKEATAWMNKVMNMYNIALDSVPNVPRDGRYSAGYYALTVNTAYGKKTPALPSGRLKGVPLANSITPHYGMEQSDLLSTLNSISGVDFPEHAENGTTVTLTVDSALFQDKKGTENLATLFKTFLTDGGMQLQPNVINRKILEDAYENPEKYPNLLVRIAGYCAYFNELSDDMKKTIINRTCYT
ncbi:MAG: pyruvate formate lyase family protein [Promethearchaeia archaeon]